MYPLCLDGLHYWSALLSKLHVGMVPFKGCMSVSVCVCEREWECVYACSIMLLKAQGKFILSDRRMKRIEKIVCLCACVYCQPEYGSGWNQLVFLWIHDFNQIQWKTWDLIQKLLSYYHCKSSFLVKKWTTNVNKTRAGDLLTTVLAFTQHNKEANHLWGYSNKWTSPYSHSVINNHKHTHKWSEQTVAVSLLGGYFPLLSLVFICLSPTSFLPTSLSLCLSPLPSFLSPSLSFLSFFPPLSLSHRPFLFTSSKHEHSRTLRCIGGRFLSLSVSLLSALSSNSHTPLLGFGTKAYFKIRHYSLQSFK